jgi:hypothetical protein
MKKYTRKWCDFHKSLWNNNVDCPQRSHWWLRSKLLNKMRVLTQSQNQKKGRYIIDVEPSAIVSTTKIHPGEPNEPEEGEHLFHSQMWVKGTLLHFIVVRGSQKILISVEVIKRLALPKMLHLQPYNIGWLCQGSDLHVSQ